jgi:hypothetical protein
MKTWIFLLVTILFSKLEIKLTFELFCFVKTKDKENKNPCKQKQKIDTTLSSMFFFQHIFCLFQKKVFFFVFSSVNATNFDILREKVTKISISPRWDKNPWDSSYILSKAISYFCWKSLANAQERHKQLGHTQCFFFGQNLLFLKPKIGKKKLDFFFLV